MCLTRGPLYLTHLPIPQRPLPSASTLRRALLAIDVDRLEERIAQFVHGLDQYSGPLVKHT